MSTNQENEDNGNINETNIELSDSEDDGYVSDTTTEDINDENELSPSFNIERYINFLLNDDPDNSQINDTDDSESN